MAQQPAQIGDGGPSGGPSGSRGRGKSKNAFRTISEVATELDVPQHVLRFWETKFVQVRPMKRGGNRRYYRPEDIELLTAIRDYLYTDGYTIKGVQKLIKNKGVRAFIDGWNEQKIRTQTVSAETPPKAPVAGSASASSAGAPDPADKALLKAVIEELKALRKSFNALGE